METYEQLRAWAESLQAQLDIERDAHTKEVRTIEEDVEAERGYTRDLRRRYKDLESENSKLRRKIEELKATDERKAIANLQGKNDTLQEELRLKTPLAEVGSDIRRRFLEQARDPLLLVPQPPNQAMIQKGNAAAHYGNGQADAAILLSVDWEGNETDRRQLRYVFKALYLHDPEEFMKLPVEIREAVDCQATIRTVVVLNKGLNRPLRERQSALDHFETIMKMAEKRKGPSGVMDDASEAELSRRLRIVKELTEDICKYDRGRRTKEKIQASG